MKENPKNEIIKQELKKAKKRRDDIAKVYLLLLLKLESKTWIAFVL